MDSETRCTCGHRLLSHFEGECAVCECSCPKEREELNLLPSPCAPMPSLASMILTALVSAAVTFAVLSWWCK